MTVRPVQSQGFRKVYSLSYFVGFSFLTRIFTGLSAWTPTLTSVARRRSAHSRIEAIRPRRPLALQCLNCDFILGAKLGLVAAGLRPMYQPKGHDCKSRRGSKHTPSSPGP